MRLAFLILCQPRLKSRGYQYAVPMGLFSLTPSQINLPFPLSTSREGQSIEDATG
jgi:hypothetical protein